MLNKKKMSYNQRLAEIIGQVDDRTYRETADAIRRSAINCLDYYLTHNKEVPVIPGANVHAFKYGIRRLLEEKEDLKRRGESNGQPLIIA